MKLKNGALVVLLNLAVTMPSYANDPFAELDQEIEQLTVDDTAEFEQWYAAHLKEFNQWQQAYLADWDSKQKASIQKWSDNKISSPEVIVVYDNKHDARTVVDLEKGEVTVSYLPKNEDETKKNQEAEIVNTVIENNAHLWEQIGVPQPSEAKPNTVVVEEAKVQKETFEQVKRKIEEQTERQMSQLDMFVAQGSSVLSEQKTEQLVSQQKEEMNKQKEKRIVKVKQALVQQEEKLKKAPRKVVAYTVKIPKSSLSERANKYLPAIKKEAGKRQLSPALVLAIMHEESHFNPKAKSHVPAYGLMQIVPTTAGHDVNKLYRGKDKPMRENDLYDPAVNIETGSAYLKILQSRYLKGIKDPQSATYSIIAAYNTGSGNVAKAFGERRVSRAIKKINSMSSDEVYQRLIKNLPYEETRNYLKKVNDRMQTYRAQSNSVKLSHLKGMGMKHHIFTAAIGALVLSGCASQSTQVETAKIDTNSASNVPNWVLNPASANGFAASNCIESSGNFSIDRNHAISLARNTLAQNLDIKVSVLEKNYQKISNSVDGQAAGSSFEQIAKQISNISIQKSQVEGISLVEIDGKKQVCALVVMPAVESENLFNSALTVSSIDPTDKASLYKEFVSQKTTKQLEEQAEAL